MPNHTPRKIPLHQRIKYSILGAVASVAFVLIPAYALVANINPAQFQAMIAQQVQQVENSLRQITLAKAIDQAQQELMNKLYEKANTLTAGLQGKLNSAVSDKLNSIAGGPVGKLLGNAGLTLGNVAGANVPGHIDPATTQRQMGELAAIKNPVDAIATAAKITLENQMHDRLNVTSMLDEKPASGNCTTTTSNCTILTLLREQDAKSVNELQMANVNAMGAQLSVSGPWDAVLLKNVYALAGKSDKEVVAFLTPSNSIPLGYDKNAETALTLQKSRWLSQVIVGTKNDMQFITESELPKDGSSDAAQVATMSKMAKTQLARGAIMNVNNDAMHTAMNSTFRACVVRPDAQDRVGATQEQQLVHLQSLQRCTNMILLQLRQQEMESQRIQGAMLLTLLDLYAVQEPGKGK